MNKPETVQDPDVVDYFDDVWEAYSEMPEMADSLRENAKRILKELEKILRGAPQFINLIKASVPESVYKVVLTGEQKAKIVAGALKILTKKDGSLLASLVNPKTGKIVQNIPLQSVKTTPAITQAMDDYAMQMQLAQIAEDIKQIQMSVEEVRQGQEYDRLAMAYSCQQKFLQALEIRNPELKAKVMLQIASDAEDSRNLLMQSQSANVKLIKDEPESFWGKLFSGLKPETIDARLNEIRESLVAVNLVSFLEAMAYQAIGEYEAARRSLLYFSAYLKKTYLASPGFVERLDQIDPSPNQYWSKTLPDMQKKIEALPATKAKRIEKRKENGEEND